MDRNAAANDGLYTPVPMSHADEQWPDTLVPVGHGLAVTEDGIHYRKTDLNLTPAMSGGDFYIFRDKERDRYRMFQYGGVLWSAPEGDTSFRNWIRGDKILPTGPQSPAGNSGECVNYFEWNGWHYVIMGRSGFWMAKDALGPYWEGVKGESRGRVHRPRWDIYDGLAVPMNAPYKDNRHLLVGNTWGPDQQHRDWAGYVVFRELIQHEDGTLGMKWVPEMIPPAERPVDWELLSTDDGAVQTGKADITLNAKDIKKAEIGVLPASYRFTATVVPSKDVEGFGLNFAAGHDDTGGCELRFIPEKKHVLMSAAP
jgi:hypothetical protein